MGVTDRRTEEPEPPRRVAAEPMAVQPRRAAEPERGNVDAGAETGKAVEPGVGQER